MPRNSIDRRSSQKQMRSSATDTGVATLPRVQISTQSDLDAEEVIRELEALCESMEDPDVVTTAYKHNRYVVHVNTRAFIPNEVVQIRVIGRSILIQGRYYAAADVSAPNKKARKYWRKLSFPSSTKLDTINTTLHDDGLCVIEGVVVDANKRTSTA